MTTIASTTSSNTEEEVRTQIRKERREARLAAQAFAGSCREGDVDALYRAVDLLNSFTIGGWPIAFRAICRLQASCFTPEMHAAFLAVWIENKSIAMDFDKHRPLIDGLRKLLPRYEGPPVRLFRGAFWRERVRRTYGLSWTSDLNTAEKFATDTRQYSAGGSCVLETEAPAEAILGNMDVVEDYYSEKEYLIDRRRLGQVRVVRRFPQLSHPQVSVL